ncbi:MAG: hypothetical protein ACYC6V_01360 [Bacillota bacterium]
MKTLACPQCGSKVVGKVGTGQYYCWDCFIEFSVGKSGPHLYKIDPEGTLVSFDPNNDARSDTMAGGPTRVG